MQKIIGRLIVGCVLACWLISNTDAQSTPPGYGTNLWIRLNGISSSNLVGIISNTISDIYFELQSKSDLIHDTQWVSTGFGVYGSELTNWTALVMTNLSRTNKAFFRIRSWVDDGSGLPIWWQMQYFGTTGVDPYGNPAGDGWNNLQKFQNGMNPNVFYTPPAPQGVTVLNNMAANQATIQWQSSPGPVTGYTVEKTDANAGTVQDFNVGTTSYQDNISGDSPGRYSGNNYEVSYRVQAHYSSGGASAWSASVPLQQATLSGSIVPGTNGATYLLVSGLPETAATVRLVYYDYYAVQYYNNFSFNTYRDIPVSAFTNGATLLPASWQSSGVDVYGNTNIADQIQSIDINGNASAASWLSFIEWNSPFYDGRVQMKQNLIFLLRAASESNPFQFTEYDTNNFYASSWGWWNPSTGGSCFGYNFTNPSNYAWASPFRANGEFDGGGNQYFFYYADEPFDDNYRYWNFVYNPVDVDGSGSLTTGANWDGNLVLSDPVYEFVAGETNAWLATNETRWLYSQWESDSYWGSDTSITSTNAAGTLTFSMARNARNLYGLPYLSALFLYDDDAGLETATLSAGGVLPLTGNLWNYPAIYVETAQPHFQTVEYDFWQPAYSSYMTPPNLDLIPGMVGFSPTNTSRLMIVPVGGSTQIAGYAKLAVTNGYPGVYAYLGQYFDQAYQIDTNGVVTTNTTGALSPYGSFFATQPGPAALVTMPDVDTGARGTCTVYCVSLVLDKNHDGNMDLPFNGADAASQASPMECWVNNGHDQPGINGNLDTDLEVPPASTNYSVGKITCPRDLENFFRLWICGVPQLPVGQGYAVTMSMSPSSGNPAINLYYSCETDGGIGYLTDTNIAATQTGSAYYDNALCTISNSQSYTLQMDSYGNLLYTHFLFEGAGIGAGQLTLTISQNENVIAQTGVWLDLHDIKDFYERVNITNIISGPSTSWTSVIGTEQYASSSALGNDTNLIVLVHGFFVGDWDWLDESDTVFKRLYWAGYQGQFMTVKWPCQTGDPLLFDLSELDAYKASAGLTTYLNQLRSRFPGYRLNILAHSQGNAIVSEAIRNQGAPFDTYILTQGAMPASAYDVNAPTNATLLNAEFGHPTPDWQPMGYHGAFTNLPGRIVNFYNTNDFLLATGTKYGVPVNWEYNQGLKPDAPYGSDGINVWEYVTGAPNMPITDSEISRGFVARSRTKAVGAQPGLNGVIKSSVDLKAQFQFGSAFDDHSAQWTWPIQTSRPYYQQVLRSCLIQPAP